MRHTKYTHTRKGATYLFIFTDGKLEFVSLIDQFGSVLLKIRNGLVYRSDIVNKSPPTQRQRSHSATDLTRILLIDVDYELDDLKRHRYLPEGGDREVITSTPVDMWREDMFNVIRPNLKAEEISTEAVAVYGAKFLGRGDSLVKWKPSFYITAEDIHGGL